jgi:hypothetical protein
MLRSAVVRVKEAKQRRIVVVKRERTVEWTE